MTRKTRFVHTLSARTIPPHIVQTLEEMPARSGMYNWIFAFRGSIIPYWDLDVREWDVIQVNMAPSDMAIIPLLREQIDRTGSKAKLVLNNDYVCEYWGKWNIHPYYYDSIQKMGDMVFSTEQHQVSNMINGAYTIPHPTNTEALKKLGTDYEDDALSFIFHWWAGETYLPHRTMMKAQERFGIKKLKCYNYNPEYDTLKRYNLTMFEETIEHMAFPDYAEMIQGDRLVYDPTPFHTYGRNGVEFACLRKPVVGSNRVFSYKKLFPKLCVDPFDFNDTMEKMELALVGDCKEMLDFAYKEVEYFNYENSVKRFLKALDESVGRGGHEWYKKHG